MAAMNLQWCRAEALDLDDRRSSVNQSFIQKYSFGVNV